MVKSAPSTYPSRALRNEIDGSIMLRVHVLAIGQAGEIQVRKSSGDKELDAAATQAAAASTFRPAHTSDGAAVDSWVLIAYRFVLEPALAPAASP